MCDRPRITVFCSYATALLALVLLAHLQQHQAAVPVSQLLHATNHSAQLHPRFTNFARRTVLQSDLDLCSPAVQGVLLEVLYELGNGPAWYNSSGWADTNPRNCFTVAENGSRLQLPAHCCYFGIGCCMQSVCPPKTTDSYSCNCTVGLLVNVTLDYNNVMGTLSVLEYPELVSALSCSLRVLSLQNNSLTGSLPGVVADLVDLRVLSLGYNSLTGTIPNEVGSLTALEEFDVQRNLLTGTVPSQLCGDPATVSTLTDVALGGNRLSGNLNLSGCESLIFLDVTDNLFDGPVIDTNTFNQLHILRMPNNNISGPINSNFARTRRLSFLNLANNSLTGTIPDNYNTLPYLVSVTLNQNLLSGTLPNTLFELGTVATIDLSYNNLTGLLPASTTLKGSAQALTSIHLNNNKVHGRIPAAMQQFARSPSLAVDLTNNFISCCGELFSPNATAAPGYQFINYSLPTLPPFLARSQFLVPQRPDAVSNLSNLLCPAFYIPGTEDTIGNRLDWRLDPEYYLFDGCNCTQGFTAVMTTDFRTYQGVQYTMGPRMACYRSPRPWYAKWPWLIVITILGSILLLLLVWLVFLRRGGRSFIQTFNNLKKRVAGEPTSGDVTVVTTDIEGYSDLFKQSPELMTKALNIHNNIIKKARWNNYGYTLEQEGDSYSLVFYEAIDAVAFCLQTQQALHRASWPPGLFPEPSTHGTGKKSKSGLHNLLSSISNISALVAGRSGPGGERSSALAGDHCDDGSLAAFMSAPLSGIVDTALMSSEANRCMAEGLLFNGLRVRMGCATGELASGSAGGIKGGSVTEMAKVVSDAGAGGQILMDARTFMAVKERLEELGAVDQNGAASQGPSGLENGKGPGMCSRRARSQQVRQPMRENEAKI